MGLKPVFIIKISAILEGLLLTPFQALAVLFGLSWVLPRLLSPGTYKILKPHWILNAGLVMATVVFGYFCLFKMTNLF